jgi:tetratricopeptide (TPR) repeat protein
LVYLGKGLNLAKSSKNGNEIISALSSIADVHRLQSKRTQAAKELKRVLALARKAGNLNKIAFILNALGQYNNFNNQKALALKQYLEAYGVAEKAGNQSLAIWCMATVGEIQGSMNNLEKSEKAFLKALAMSRKKNDLYQIAYCEGSLAQVYEQRHEYDKATRLYESSLEKALKINDKLRAAYALNALGTNHYRNGRYNEAIDFFTQAKVIAEETQNGHSYTSACSGLARTYRDMKKYRESLAAGLDALNIGQMLDDKNEIQEAALELHQTYAVMHNIPKAYEMHLLYAEMKDSTSKYEDVRKFANAEYTARARRMELQQKQKEAVHKANQAKKEAELNQQKMLRNTLIGFALVLLLFSGVIYRSLKQSQHAKKIITEKNQIIEQRQKEVLDSIHYAKRIQDALLPSERYIKKHLRKRN